MTPRSLLLGLLVAAGTTAHAVPVQTLTLGFDDIPSVASFDVVGAAYGSVTFTGDALKVDNADGLGPYAENLPSGSSMLVVPLGSAALSASDPLQVFAGTLSFSYTSLSLMHAAVQLFSGADGTGTLLGSFDLLGDGAAGCASGLACQWHTASLDFSGGARSIVFTGADAAYDDVTVTLHSVPEPAAVWLLLGGLVAAGAASRRRG